MRLPRAVFGLMTALALGGAAPLWAQQAAHTPPRMLHPVAGKQDCLSCHGAGANAHITSVPASHHFANGACGMCHKPSAEVPPPMKHAADEAHAECRKCHVQAAEGAAAATPTPGAAPAPPASHARFDGSTCKLCHGTASSGGSGGE